MKAHSYLAFFMLSLSVNFLNSQNVFDESSGFNNYYELEEENWVFGELFELFPNAGTEMIMSANGNEDISFFDIGIEKQLGGVIMDSVYRVSFYIAKYDAKDGEELEGVEFSDFSELRIGGPEGTIVWDSVPTPEISGEWVKWSGIYTPTIGDIGGEFVFKGIFTLDGRHSIAIDGPMTSPNTTTQTNTLVIGNEQLQLPYPNPFYDHICFQFPLNQNTPANVNIYNLNGEIIFKDQVTEDHVIYTDLESLAAGVYFYNVIVNEISFTGKIIHL